MANGEFSRARQELIRAAKFNRKPIDSTIEHKISLLNDKICTDKLRNELSMSTIIGDSDIDKQLNHQHQHQHHHYHQSVSIKSLQGKNTKDVIIPKSSSSTLAKSPKPASSIFSSYKLVFSNSTYLRDTIIIAYISFTGHLFYYLQTINFGYTENLSIEANFISSGAGEWFSLIVGAILLKFLNRKTCMSMFLFIMTLSFIFQSLIDSNYAQSINTPLIVTLNNTIGTLASLLLVFVVLIVNQEVYPTVIRQTGSSIGNTLGESGSTLAPWLIQLNRSFGLWRADLVCASMCLVGMLSAFFVTKTDNIELVDV